MPLPYDDSDPLALYRYFPSFIKLRDEEAGVDANGEAILQKITYMLEKEAGAHVEMLRRLLVNLDVDNCPVTFVDYLAFIFGEKVPGDWTDDRRRQFLQDLPDLLKIKGTHLNLVRRAAFHDERGVRAIELFKNELYEDNEYSRSPSSFYTMKSARIDVIGCSYACETLCESSCESAEQIEGEDIPASTAELLLEHFGEVLPVHVRVRRQARVIEPSYPFFDGEDTIGCRFYCETLCETACEFNDESWPGSEVYATFADRAWSFRESTSYSLVCLDSCETICETCCECGTVQTACETACEAACELICEDYCQSMCMVNCQTNCQGGACQWGCQVYCETICEHACEPTVEGP